MLQGRVYVVRKGRASVVSEAWVQAMLETVDVVPMLS